MDYELVKKIADIVISRLNCSLVIPVEASARHVHLNKDSVPELFGPGYEMTKRKELSQPGQFQYNERVMLIGPKGVLNNAAVLGPLRDYTQVEISRTDAAALGIDPPVRESGDLKGSGSIYIAGPRGVFKAPESTIIAMRHIHMTNEDARKFNVCDRQIVKVEVRGSRPLIFDDVIIRVSDKYALSMHMDFDEYNAAGCTPETTVSIYR